jgi:hypothetical protein
VTRGKVARSADSAVDCGEFSGFMYRLNRDCGRRSKRERRPYPQRSGRTMARTGLRMMPTFPSSPLKFRTAGFPQYGFKAGLSADAFPRAATTCRAFSVCILPSCSTLSAFRSPRCVGVAVRSSTTIQAATPLYPRGPRSGPGYSVPVHHHLCGPIRPTRRHSAISLLCSLYAMSSLCVSA